VKIARRKLGYDSNSRQQEEKNFNTSFDENNFFFSYNFAEGAADENEKNFHAVFVSIKSSTTQKSTPVKNIYFSVIIIKQLLV